jgi:hypothetical protein
LASTHFRTRDAAPGSAGAAAMADGSAARDGEKVYFLRAPARARAGRTCPLRIGSPSLSERDDWKFDFCYNCDSSSSERKPLHPPCISGLPRCRRRRSAVPACCRCEFVKTLSQFMLGTCLSYHSLQSMFRFTNFLNLVFSPCSWRIFTLCFRR